VVVDLRYEGENAKGEQTMQNYEEIVADVISLLSQPDGLKKLRERRKFAAKMANALEALDALKPKRKMTRGAVLTVNQGSLQNGKRGLRVFVELHGQRVGEIIFPGPGSPDHPVFTCTKPTASAKIGAKFQWSLNRKDGDAIKKYLASCETLRPQPERSAWKPVVRWMLATKEPGTLTGLRPVMPAGCMMEMPVAVTANLAVGTGNIDILARSGRGRAGRFIACELKAPDANVKSYLVLRQAIRYAAALDAEINGSRTCLSQEIAQPTEDFSVQPDKRVCGSARLQLWPPEKTTTAQR
jgi:hypothetical protein